LSVNQVTGIVQVQNLRTGANQVLEGHTDIVTATSFSSDSFQLVTASQDGIARVWKLQTGASQVLEGHTGEIYNASFNPDDTLVITSSYDSTTRVWDLQGRQLAIFEGYPAALSPDGQQVNAIKDGRLETYEIGTLPELLAWGCQWLHNYLEYGQATDGDRALCNLPPRDSAPTGPFESSLGRSLVQVQVTWPQRG